MDQSTLMAAFLAVLFVAGGMIIFAPAPNKAQKRVQDLANVGSGNSRTKKGGMFGFMKGEETSSRRKQIEDSLSEIEAKQKDKKRRINSIKAKLIQADSTMTAQTFMFMSIGIGAGIGFFLMMLTGKIVIAAGAGFAAGFGMPRWVLNFKIGRRQKKFVANFADAMDIIVRGIRTGLPLGDCLKIIAHEAPDPVGAEFRLVVEGESVGVPLEVCLERMYDRMPVSEVNFFATVLNIQRTTGGNLGEALNNLSNVLRGRKLLTEKIKALSAEAKMSAIIIGALPIVVMILVSIASPDYMTELYTTKTGHRNMMIGAGMMVVGTLMMRKMINFKY